MIKEYSRTSIREWTETLKTSESLERVHSTMSRKEYSRI
jgi:hypothetical protein